MKSAPSKQAGKIMPIADLRQYIADETAKIQAVSPTMRSCAQSSDGGLGDAPDLRFERLGAGDLELLLYPSLSRLLKLPQYTKCHF
jgi:hypothetical protein